MTEIKQIDWDQADALYDAASMGYGGLTREALTTAFARHREQAEAGEAVPVDARIETYEYMSEIATGLGYESILEALEDLERKLNPADKVETETPISLTQQDLCKVDLERAINMLASQWEEDERSGKRALSGLPSAILRDAEDAILALMGKPQGEGDREG